MSDVDDFMFINGAGSGAIVPPEGGQDVLGGLVDWLRAQLDEDERVARACIYTNATGRWHIQAEEHFLHEAVTDETGLRLATGSAAVNVHAARHDPARVLREVEAKRQILGEIVGGPSCSDMCYHDLRETTLQLLALPYADRPGYREEWRPA